MCPQALSAVTAQLATLPFAPRRFTHPLAVECARALAELAPDDLNRVLFVPGGTAAIGMALKLARFITGNHKVVSLWDSFHGASLDAISVGGEDLHYADYLEYVIEKEGGIGAFIAEPIRNTDVQIPSKAYWQRIRQICDRHGVLLIADEIPNALGRTGRWLSMEHFGITPDIICLGKGLGGGIVPFAAMITRDRFNQAAQISLGHYTHEKSPLGCAAALATLNVIRRDKLLAKVQADEAFMAEALSALEARHPQIGQCRGLGLLWAIELVSDRQSKERACDAAQQVLYACLRRGLSFKLAQGNVIQLSPPLVISRDELQRAITILDQALTEVGAR